MHFKVEFINFWQAKNIAHLCYLESKSLEVIASEIIPGEEMAFNISTSLRLKEELYRFP